MKKDQAKNLTLGALFVIALFAFNAFGQAKLPESSIKTIYITPLSHYDFGFVEAPDDVRKRAVRHIDEVIRVAEENPDFRWTIESVWQVNEWLKAQKKPTSVLPKDKENIARLMNLIKSGRIALSTAWGSMHTDFMGGEELNRLCYDYTRISRTYGVRSELATMDDVPGHPTSLPSVLAGSGTKYLVTGANLFIGVATSLAPGKVPFYWRSPDGSKVLTWISQGKRGGYVEGLTDFYLDPYSLDPYTDKTPFDMFNPELAGKKTDLEIMEIGVTELLNRYNSAGYKYDVVMAMYAHDFIEPTDVINLEKAVKLWNGKHDEVKLKIATPTEFLSYIEKKYANELPTYSGEWSGLWSEAKTQSPKISALARYAHDHSPAAESLWSGLSMTRSFPAPVGNFTSIYDLMFTYDEHSGAGNNGWPQLNSREPLNEQNRQYVGYMKSAKDEIDELFDEGIAVLAQPTRFDETVVTPSDTHYAVVFNGLSWERSDVVRLAPPRDGAEIMSITRSDTGENVVFDVDHNGEAIFVAEKIPSLGYASFTIKTRIGKAEPTLSIEKGFRASNENFAVEVLPDGNVKSIRDVKTGREIVNDKGELPFNELLRVEGSDASRVVYPVKPHISISRGKVVTRINIYRERSAFPTTTLTMYNGIGRVDIHNELDPKYMPFTGGNGNWHDSYYFAFPLNVPAAGLKVIRGGQKWFDMLPDDYLPDARRDAVTTQHLFGFTDGKTSAMIAHRQAFHWVYPSYVSTKVRPKDAPKEFPAMFTGKFPLPEATIYSRAVRKGSQADTHDLGIVNVETVEPGLRGNYVFDYSVADGSVFDPVAGWRFGADFNVPLIAKYSQVLPHQNSQSLFAVDQPNVQIVTVKPISDSVIRGEVSAAPLDPQVNKVFVVRLQEFAGRGTTVKVSLPTKIKSAERMTLNEEKVIGKIDAIAPLTVTLKPFETATIKFVIE